MSVRIEFFGVPRHRAGVVGLDVAAATLGTAVLETVRRFPALKEFCAADGALCPGFLANVNGRTFVSDPATPLADGDSVLILSSDVGG